VQKDFGLIQIAVWEVPISFRWPKEGENWTVYRENGFWMLGSPEPKEDEVLPIESLAPGDTRIGTEGSTVHVVGNLSADIIETLNAKLDARPILKHGNGTLAWPGGTNDSTPLVVTHGLGLIPTAVIVTANSKAGTGAVMVHTTAKSSTTFTVQASTVTIQPPNTATTPFSWMVA
jgi:hypothetical protein